MLIFIPSQRKCEQLQGNGLFLLRSDSQLLKLPAWPLQKSACAIWPALNVQFDSFPQPWVESLQRIRHWDCAKCSGNRNNEQKVLLLRILICKEIYQKLNNGYFWYLCVIFSLFTFLNKMSVNMHYLKNPFTKEGCKKKKLLRNLAVMVKCNPDLPTPHISQILLFKSPWETIN